MRLILLSLMLIAAFAVITHADGITVSQSVDRDQIAYEDSLTFTVSLQWPGPQYAYRFDRPLDPTFEGLKVASFASSIASSGAGASETTTKEYHFRLVPTSAGPARIDAIEISFTSYPDSLLGHLMTEPVTIMVAQPLPVKEPSRISSGRIVTILGVLVVLGAGVTLFLRRRRLSAPVEIPLTPTQAVAEGLTMLHKESGGDFKKFQSGLYRILVEYLKASYNVDVDSLNDDRLTDAVEATALPESAKEKITTWLLTARKDKFRPVAAAPGEAIRLESEVRELFEKL